jgi:hypothetical protein
MFMPTALLLGTLFAPSADVLPGAVMRVWQVDRPLAALAPLVPGQSPNAWIRLDTINLDGDRGAFGPFEDDFIAMVDGSFVVELSGEYNFRLTSDDGSQLWIAGHRVIDNDGLHGAEAKTGSLQLEVGVHPFQVKFFERGSSARLLLEWMPPGSKSFVIVPPDAIRSSWPKKREITAGTKAVAPRFTNKVDVGPEPSGPHNVLTDEQSGAGWELLFDGTEASPWWRGFKKKSLPEGWIVEDGMLIRAAPGGDIITRDQFADFELSLDWMVQPGGNSGIFFRGSEEFDWIWATAPEMQILDNIGHGDGASSLHSAGACYALYPPPVDSSRPAGQWNRVVMRLQGDHMQFWLNGVQTVDCKIGSDDWKRRVADSKFWNLSPFSGQSSGHIALQDHGDRVAFRNIRIRRLDQKSSS